MLDSWLGEAVEDKRRINGLQVLCVALNIGGRRSAGAAGFFHASTLRRSDRRRREALVKFVDLQHLGNRGHAANGFLGKGADLKSQRAHPFSVDIHPAAPLPCNYSGVLRLLPNKEQQSQMSPVS